MAQRKIEVESIEAATMSTTMSGPKEITVMYPEQTFSPVPYNTFKVGGIFYKTFVQPGETEEEAYERAWEFVSNLARTQYAKLYADFRERYEGRAL